MVCLIVPAFNNGGSNSINNWDTSSVTTMRFMFRNTGVFNQNIGSWDTSNVTVMTYMFYVSTFDQDIASGILGVTEMGGMFAGQVQRPNVFNQDIGNWDVSSVTSSEFCVLW